MGEVENFQFGVYEHYKGPHYRAVQIVYHHEDCKEWVVYQALYGEYQYFIRPLDMFLEEVEVDGVKKPRFRYIGVEASGI